MVAYNGSILITLKYWYAILVFIWACIYITRFINIRYADATGRKSFWKDTHRYMKSYKELVEYFKDADPHRLDISTLPVLHWSEGSGIILGTKDGHLISLGTDCEANIYVNGPPGSGKTSGIACCSAARWGMEDASTEASSASVLGLDIKGDITTYLKNTTNRSLLIFCPDAPDATLVSAHFNVFEGFDELSQTEKKLFLSNIAAVLIPDDGGSDGNYFTSRARKLFIGVCWYVYDHHIHDPSEPYTFPHILDTILHPGKTDYPTDVFSWIKTIVKGHCDEATEQVASFIGNSEKNVSGAWDALCTALVPFSNEVLNQLLDGQGQCISLDALDNGYDCYLQIKQENLTTYAPLFTMIIESITTQLMRRPDASSGIKNRPILILLDEMSQLTFTYGQINTILATLRSKACVTMIICQDRSQLEKNFHKEGARSILSNCRYQVILGCHDPESQKYFSDLIGSKKVLKIVDSQNSTKISSFGRSVQESREPIIYPADFGQMEFEGKKDQIVIYFAGQYIIADKVKCYEP